MKQLQTITESVRKNDDIIIRYVEKNLFDKNKKRQSYKFYLTDRIFKILEERFTISDLETIKVTVSIEVNLNPQDSRTFSEAFKLVDRILHV